MSAVGEGVSVAEHEGDEGAEPDAPTAPDGPAPGGPPSGLPGAPTGHRWRWALAVGVLLIGSFLVRIWGAKQGLPYAYNADENAHFVPKAIGLFGHGLNPHYFVNPPLLTYIFHGVFAVWFGGRAGVSQSFAADPTEVF
ncbi:MAG TPA: hypothetical protein VGM33_23645, partial [Baekduia sp.]